MSHDKNDKSNSLIQVLGTLNHDFRIQIMQILNTTGSPQDFSEIKNQLSSIQAAEIDSKTVTYHLKPLKEAELITLNSDQKYHLTNFGERVANEIHVLEQVIATKNPKIMIRTSRYALEPFDESKIQSALIKEANMSPDQARPIAQEAKERLEKARVTYLTAPLIREYINAILIEHRLEDFRHRLTRLGLPPYDIQEKINANIFRSPTDLINSVGNSSIEQFVLLNQLQQTFADAILSSKISVGNLARFGIAPLEIIISGRDLLNAMQWWFENKRLNESTKNSHKIMAYENTPNFTFFQQSITSFILIFIDVLNTLAILFPISLTVIRFDWFLSEFLSHYTIQDLQSLFLEGFSRVNFEEGISLQIDTCTNFSELNPLLEIYQTSLECSNHTWNQLPILQLHLSKDRIKEVLSHTNLNQMNKQLQIIIPLSKSHQINLTQNVFWGQPDLQYVFTPLDNPVYYENEKMIGSRVIIEKIGINLLKIGIDTLSKASSFWDGLENAIHQVFDLLELKMQLIKKNFNHFQTWQIICKMFPLLCHESEREKHKLNLNDKYTLGVISYFGLDECVFLLSGLPIRNSPTSRNKAVEILSYIHKLIEKQNELDSNGIQYIMAEMHPNASIFSPTDDYLSEIYPKYEKLSLEPPKVYSLTTPFPTNGIKWNSFLQTFTELNQSKFPSLSVNLLLTPTISNDVYLKYVQDLLKCKCNRIGCTQKYIEKDNSSLNSIRFFGKYQNYNTLLQKRIEKLFDRKDLIDT